MAKKIYIVIFTDEDNFSYEDTKHDVSVFNTMNEVHDFLTEYIREHCDENIPINEYFTITHEDNTTFFKNEDNYETFEVQEIELP